MGFVVPIAAAIGSAVSAAAPALSAIAGIASAIVPLFGGGAQAPGLPAPVTAEDLAEDTAAEQEERQRALRRRRNAKVRGGLLTLDDEDEKPEVTKTLLGD